MFGLLNKTFLTFLVRFIMIVLIGISGVFVAGIIDELGKSTATVRVQE